MKPQTILFDLDDTLIHCNKYFGIVLEQFADLVSGWFSSYSICQDEIRRKQYELDVANIGIHGFGATHFPKSLVETYRHFATVTGRKPSEQEEEQLLKLGRSVYEMPVEPYPGMVETLDRLVADGHTLYLYTGGVVEVQHKKVMTAGLDRYFGERVFVRQHKTADALEEIVREQGFDRRNTWMIGNSIRTDIVPALKSGLHAIFIPALAEWDYDFVEIDETPRGAFLKLKSLEQVPDAIRGYLSGATASC